MNNSTPKKQAHETKGSKVNAAGSAAKKLLRPSSDTLFLVRLMARVLSPAY